MLPFVKHGRYVKLAFNIKLMGMMMEIITKPVEEYLSKDFIQKIKQKYSPELFNILVLKNSVLVYFYTVNSFNWLDAKSLFKTYNRQFSLREFSGTNIYFQINKWTRYST